MAKLIEKQDVEKEYRFSFLGVNAIVEHPTYGRIYICDGYTAHKLHEDDTMMRLEEYWSNNVSIREAMLAHEDDSRPLLDVSGLLIAKIAREVGI